MGPVLKDVLKSKSFLWPVSSFSVLFTLLFVYFFTIREVQIFPKAKAFKYDYYTDKPNGGNSQIVNFSTTDFLIRVDFDLKEGFLSPYIGISISPLQLRYMNVKGNNQLSIKLRGGDVDRVGVSIFTPPCALAKNKQADETVFHTYLNISDREESYNIPFRKLNVPEWWKDLHGIPTEKKLNPDVSRILHLNIGTALHSNIKKRMYLEIYAISVTRDNRSVYLLLGCLELGVILLFFGLRYLRYIKKNKKEPITILYKPLDIIDKKILYDGYIEYISQHFAHSELSLEMVSKATSIPAKRITQSIHAEFNCNFRTYVNRIRVNESKRLLIQTNLNIGEIAYTIGFNNQSSFNRVFKSELNISPTEYREKFRK